MTQRVFQHARQLLQWEGIIGGPRRTYLVLLQSGARSTAMFQP